MKIIPMTTLDEIKDDSVDLMVTRFLSWKLPQDFSPDAGISFNVGHTNPSHPWWPVGTNLFTALQAREMIKHMLGGDE